MKRREIERLGIAALLLGSLAVAGCSRLTYAGRGKSGQTGFEAARLSRRAFSAEAGRRFRRPGIALSARPDVRPLLGREKGPRPCGSGHASGGRQGLCARLRCHGACEQEKPQESTAVARYGQESERPFDSAARVMVSGTNPTDAQVADLHRGRRYRRARRSGKSGRLAHATSGAEPEAEAEYPKG